MNIPIGNFINNRLFAAIIIFVVAFSIYIPSVTMPLINDEAAFIKRNEAKSFVEYVHLFDKKDYDGAYYRPLPNFVSGIINGIAPFNVTLNRLINMIIHGINAVLLYFFVFYLFDKKNNLIPFIASLLFAVFPVSFIAVIWITDLFDRLLLTFFLLSLIFFLKKRGVNAVSLLFFALALLCKEMAFSLPLVVIILGYNINKSKNRFKGPLLNSVPYFIVLIVFLAFRIFILDNNIFYAEDAHRGTGIITIIKNLLIFSGILSFPFFLKEIQSYLLTNLYLVAAVFLIISGLVFLFRKQLLNKTNVINLLLVLVTLIPVARLVMRWYLYLPAAFFAVFVTSLINEFKMTNKIKYFIFGVIALAYSFSLINHQIKWNKVAKKSEASLQSVLIENRDLINSSTELVFLTIPAKIGEYPLYQLGFDIHVNHLIKSNKPVEVKSRSFLNSIDDKIELKSADERFVLRHNNANYFILFDVQKNSKLVNPDFISENDREISLSNTKEPSKIIFTFSDGRFIKL